MKLKPDTDLKQFFDEIYRCEGDVWFCTPEGNQLNLRSRLTQYIFAAAFSEGVLTLDGNLQCECETDSSRLSEYTA